jgi:hypothetical protein
MIINYDEVVADLEAIIAEYGEDHVYWSPSGGSECLYVHVNDETNAVTPGCLVGVWLARRGVDLTAMHRAENATAEEFVPQVLNDEITLEALYLLKTAQDYQDQHSEWGPSLRDARSATAEIDWSGVDSLDDLDD